jgi:very-short-patch-repair endonuclease
VLVSVEAHPSERAVRWAGLPVHGVVRVIGVDRAAMAVALDSLAPEIPAVIGCDVEPSDPAPRIVEDVLHQLATVARELFPVWLPGGENAGGVSDFDRRTIRALARSLALTTDHYGPYVEAVAEDALTGRSTGTAFPPDARARGLRRILTAAYRRDGLVIMIVGCSPAGEHRGIETAAAWLADHGGVGVWLVGPELAGLDRFPVVAPRLPDFVVTLPAETATAPDAPDYPAVAGRPHPRSGAELLLESRLATLEWARDRVWNQVHQAHALAPPIRVDLVFPRARCAVEIDGPDHRGALKYADDRRRDNGLVLDGYAVLRFTNDDVHDDVARVLDTIERLLMIRTPRKGETL